jgi:anti-sigma regulatory factor (Ser/Thr protein kinase)
MRLMSCMSSCSFQIDSDSTMIAPVVNFLHRFIHSTHLCDETSGIRVCVALEEALNNALFHGNLEISSDAREGDRAAYRRLIEERRATSPYKDRKVLLTVSIHDSYGRFTIRDEGPGFDKSILPDPTDPVNLERPRGRGLLLMRTFMDEVRFNENGNEVILLKHKAPATASH